MSNVVMGNLDWEDEDFAGIKEIGGKYYVEVKANGNIDLVTEEEIPQEPNEEIPADEIIAEIEGEKVAKSKKKAV